MTKQQLEKELSQAQKLIRALQEELEQTSLGVEAIEQERLADLEKINKRLRAEVKTGLRTQEKLAKTVAELQKSRQNTLHLLLDLKAEAKQRRKSEQALGKSEANLRSLINARSESIWSIDRNFKFIIFNEKFAANYRLAYGLTLKYGLSAVDILSPKLSSFWLPKYQQALQGQRQIFEFSEQLPDGLHYYEVALNPIRSGKEIIGVSAISSDFTNRKKIETALRETSERFRLAFQTSPDAINISRLKDGMYVDVNQGFTEITGYSRDEVIGKTSLEINLWTNPSDRRRLVKGLKEYGRVNNMEVQFRMKDGTFVTGLMSASIIMLKGRPHILSISRNIENLKRLETERKQLLHETETARKLLSDVFSRINDGVVALDKNWRYTYLNEQAAKMLNRKKPEDLLGRHIWTEYPGSTDLPFFKAYHKAMETQQAIYLQEFYQPWNHWFENRIYPSADGLTVYLTDITDRKQAELALRESEERYRSLFENSPVALWQEDLTEMIRYLHTLLQKRAKKQNFKTFLDRHPQEVKKLLSSIHVIDINQAAVRLHHAQNKQELMDHIEQLFTEDSYVLFKEELQALAQGQNSYENEERVKTIDGHIKYIYLRFSLKRPQPGSGEKYLGLIATMDITDLKQAEQEARRSQARLQLLHQMDSAILQASSVADISYAALENLYQIIPAKHTNIAIFHKEAKKALIYSRGLPEQEIGRVYSAPLADAFYDMAGLHAGRVIRMNNLEKTAAPNGFPARLKISGIRSALNFPIRAHTELLGSLNLAFEQADAFSEEIIEVGKEVADSIAIALQQARLHEALEEHALNLEQSLHELQQIYRLSLHLGGTMDVKQVAKEALKVLGPALQPDILLFYLRKKDKLKLLSKHIYKTNLKTAQIGPHYAGDCLCGLTAQSGRPVFSLNIRTDKRCTLKECKNAGITSFAGLPLLVSGKVIGVIGLGSIKERDFTTQRSFLETLVNEAAVGLQNALLLQELRRHEAELKERVALRTAELERANRELESFSYSVSHDLRAPLRAIDGFSRILAEDYVQQLGHEANRLIDVVRSNTQRMGQLIDDLLNFSRFSRQSITLSQVDLSNLADSIYHELTDEAQRRRIRFSVQKLPHAQADSSLLRQVFTNLIANALKFSSGRKTPKIDIGFKIENGQTIYYIKDNGVGFNMKYAGKLFQIFQRLHSNEEFPGTGIGLSIVERIINRHGGRIWAEAQEGKGASFYFTLTRDKKAKDKLP